MSDHSQVNQRHHGSRRDISGFVICLLTLVFAGYIAYDDLTTGAQNELGLKSVVAAILVSSAMIYSKLDQIRQVIERRP